MALPTPLPGAGGSGAADEAEAHFGGAVGKFITDIGALSLNLQFAIQGISSLSKAIISLPAAPINAFATAVGAMQAPVVAVVDSLKSFVSAVGAVGSAISEFVKLSNPVYVQKFNMAMEDLMASIGKILTPILITSTAFVRAFADVIFKLSDPLQKLVAAFFDPLTEILPVIVNFMAPFVELFAEFAKIMAQVLAPIMKVLVPLFAAIALGLAAFLALGAAPTIIGAIVLAIGAFVSVVVSLAIAFAPLIILFGAIGYAIYKLTMYVAKFLGITGIAGGSTGAAVRPASFGSVEDYGKKAQQAAFSLGTASGDVAVESRDYLKMIAEYFLKGGFKDDLKRLVPDLGIGGDSDSPGSLIAGGVDAGRRLEAGGPVPGSVLWHAMRERDGLPH